jgi:hypothetical protein
MTTLQEIPYYKFCEKQHEFNQIGVQPYTQVLA